MRSLLSKPTMMSPRQCPWSSTSPHPLLCLSKRSTHLLFTSKLTSQLRAACIHHSHLDQLKPSLEWAGTKNSEPQLELSHLDWWPPSTNALPLLSSNSQWLKDVPTNWMASLSNATLRYADSGYVRATLTCPMTMNATMGKLMPKSPLKMGKISKHDGSTSWGMGRSLPGQESTQTSQNTWSLFTSSLITHNATPTLCLTGSRSSSSPRMEGTTPWLQQLVHSMPVHLPKLNATIATMSNGHSSRPTTAPPLQQWSRKMSASVAYATIWRPGGYPANLGTLRTILTFTTKPSLTSPPDVPSHITRTHHPGPGGPA
jgi:hypothetical protein